MGTPYQAALQAAIADYSARGWAVVALKPQTKRPDSNGEWQLHKWLARDFGASHNIGVMLGELSGGLIDVDLDCDEARAIAGYFLPATQAMFGRAGARYAHRLYISPLLVSSLPGKLTRKDPISEAVLLELRCGSADGIENAHQTMFPPSVWRAKDGSRTEEVRWEGGDIGEPSSPEPEALLKRVGMTAAMALIVRYFPVAGGHDAVLAIGGFLGHCGISDQEARLFGEALNASFFSRAGRTEWKRTLLDGFEHYRSGHDRSPGFPRLASIFDRKVVESLADWLGYKGARQEARAKDRHQERSRSPAQESLGERDIGDITMPGPRAFLLGISFCRGFHSSLIGPGGVGKTALRYAQYLSLASGRSLTGEHIFQRSRVLILSFEDSIEELERRLWAVMLHYKITPQEVAGWLFYATPGQAAGKLAVLNETGEVIPADLATTVALAIQRLNIDLVGIDPFVKAHGIPENDNTQMDKVMEILIEIAIKYNIATDAATHVRKGPDVAGNPDAGRGASAQVNATRLAYTLTKMSKEDAEAFGISEEDRRSLVRLDSAKITLAVEPEAAQWFRLVSVPLGNATELYPNGDSVQTVAIWPPPKAFSGLPIPSINDILDELGAGMADGERFSTGSNARDRAAWKVVSRHVPEKADKQARGIIAAWIKSGLLIEGVYFSRKRRANVYGVYVDDTKRPT